MVARIALIGEAWGQQEAILQRPFVGPAGQELDNLLRAAGIERSSCLVTNLIQAQPPDNNFDYFTESVREASTKPPEYVRALKSLSAVTKGRHLKPEYHPQLARLKKELQEFAPTVAVALGGKALWALTGLQGIMKNRGTCLYSNLITKLKVLPTLHPAFLLPGRGSTGDRFWSIVVADLVKAKQESLYPEVRHVNRNILVEPTLADLAAYRREFIDPLSGPLAVDIETFHGQITCIGFSRSANSALVIPFVGFSRPWNSYWQSTTDELAAWGFVIDLLRDHTIPKLFHNYLYDVQYLWRCMKIKVRPCVEDTMHLHHALFAEMRKKLDFLGNIYCNEAGWKGMKPKLVDEDDEK